MDIGIRADGMTTSDFENFAIEIAKKKFEIRVYMDLRKGEMTVLMESMISNLLLLLFKLSVGR